MPAVVRMKEDNKVFTCADLIIYTNSLRLVEEAKLDSKTAPTCVDLDGKVSSFNGFISIILFSLMIENHSLRFNEYLK